MPEPGSKTSIGKVLFYASIASGLVAAYLMYRRGESLGTIARHTITNPVGSMISEVKDAV
jgi:formate-dependent nitrite reductase membrane component NrfD